VPLKCKVVLFSERWSENANISIDQKDKSMVAIIESSEIEISDVQGALELMASVN
jgi:hypothetical protein